MVSGAILTRKHKFTISRFSTLKKRKHRMVTNVYHAVFFFKFTLFERMNGGGGA